MALQFHNERLMTYLDQSYFEISVQAENPSRFTEHLMQCLRTTGVVRLTFVLSVRKPSLLFPSTKALWLRSAGTMKRKAVDTKETPIAKRQREQVPEYCDVQPRKDDKGFTLWPASPSAIEDAQTFLKEWYVLEPLYHVYN